MFTYQCTISYASEGFLENGLKTAKQLNGMVMKFGNKHHQSQHNKNMEKNKKNMREPMIQHIIISKRESKG